VRREDVDAGTLAPFDDAFIVQLAVGSADGVGVQTEAARHLACAGKALAGAEISARDPQRDLRADLLAETDLAGMDEPEAHGRG